MSMERDNGKRGLSRRDSLKLSGLAMGGLALESLLGRSAAAASPGVCDHGPCYPTSDFTNQYSYLKKLDPLPLYTPLEENELRISFMGSMIPPVRRAQAEMSVFVEVGWVPDKTDKVYQGRAVDQFIFDCGSGVSGNYGAMGVGFRRMDKVFVNHLHADHMSDLSHIYCFGPSGDRKSPLYVWGPGPSGIRNPRPPHQRYNDGVKALCSHLREALRWHTESFGFQPTAYRSFRPPTRRSWGLPHDPVPVGDDPHNDAYALVPIELDWTNYGQRPGDNVAYHNRDTDVKITHFPVIHTRRGSLGYKLEWNGLTIIYTADTKPEQLSIQQANNGGKGVDVFIHEMVVPAEIWAMKNIPGLTAPPPKGSDPTFDATVQDLQTVQDSSHTPQGAFGYLLSQINPRPKLTVATHFPVADDTVDCALASVRRHVPDVVWDPTWDPVHKNILWSFDTMVLRLFAGENRILQQRMAVNDFNFSPPTQVPDDLLRPKYHDASGDGDPYAQIDRTLEIQAGDNTYCSDGY